MLDLWRLPGESARRVTTKRFPSTTSSTGSSPGGTAGAKPGIAFSSGSAARLESSCRYTLHIIDRLDHPGDNIKRWPGWHRKIDGGWGSGVESSQPLLRSHVPTRSGSQRGG